MAGDWIKMRSNLWDDPRVMRMVDVTDSSEAQVIGALYWLWSTADQHSSDGWMPGLTLRQIDRKAGVAGIGAAIAAVGWLEVADDGVMLSRFNEHNGASAKARHDTAKRVQEHRKRKAVTEPLQDRYLEKEKEKEKEEGAKEKATVQPAAAPVPPDGLPDDIATPAGPAQEPAKSKRKPQTAVRFPEFWAAYPVKKGKVPAMKTWKAKGLDEMADTLLAHIRLMEREDDAWKRGIIPHGSTYLNQERWTDEPTKDRADTPITVPSSDTFGAKAVLAKNDRESRYENACAYIRQQRSVGAYGEGPDADAIMRQKMGEARDKFMGAQ